MKQAQILQDYERRISMYIIYYSTELLYSQVPFYMVANKR